MFHARTGRLAVALVAALLGAALLASAVVANHGKRSKTLMANMTGAQEAPDPGDEDGRGKAVVRIRPNAGRVCFVLTWRRIGRPNLAHIHKGARGQAGPPVVTLFDGDPVRRACIEDLDKALLRNILRRPRAYYVNVHNAEFPAGAIRGQLKKVGRRGHRH